VSFIGVQLSPNKLICFPIRRAFPVRPRSELNRYAASSKQANMKATTCEIEELFLYNSETVYSVQVSITSQRRRWHSGK